MAALGCDTFPVCRPRPWTIHRNPEGLAMTPETIADGPPDADFDTMLAVNCVPVAA